MPAFALLVLWISLLLGTVDSTLTVTYGDDDTVTELYYFTTLETTQTFKCTLSSAEENPDFSGYTLHWEGSDGSKIQEAPGGENVVMLNIEDKANLKSPYKCVAAHDTAAEEKEFGIYNIEAEGVPTVVEINKAPTSATHKVTTGNTDLTAADVTVACVVGGEIISLQEGGPDVTDGVVSVMAQPLASDTPVELSVVCTFTFVEKFTDDVTAKLSTIKVSLTKSLPLAIIGKEIVFTCKCEAVAEGSCGELTIADDADNAASFDPTPVWDVDHITGLYTKTYSTSDKAEENSVTCSTEEAGGTLAVETFNILEWKLMENTKKYLALNQEAEVKCTLDTFADTSSVTTPTAEEVTFVNAGTVTKDDSGTVITYKAMVDSDGTAVDLAVKCVLNGPYDGFETTTSHEVTVIALASSLPEITVLEAVDSCPLAEVTINADYEKTNPPTITWTDGTNTDTDKAMTQEGGTGPFTAPDPTFDCAGTVTGTVKFTGDAVYPDFELETTTDVKEVELTGKNIRFIEGSNVDTKNYGAKIVTETADDAGIVSKVTCDSETDSTEVTVPVTVADAGLVTPSCTVTYTRDETEIGTKTFDDYTMIAKDTLMLSPDDQEIFREENSGTELSCTLSGPTESERTNSYEADDIWKVSDGTALVTETDQTDTTLTTFTISPVFGGVYSCNLRSRDGTGEKLSLSTTLYILEKGADKVISIKENQGELTLTCEFSVSPEYTGGDLGATYAWSKDSAAMDSETSKELVVAEPSADSTYECTVTVKEVTLKQTFTFKTPAMTITPAEVYQYENEGSDIIVTITGFDSSKNATINQSDGADPLVIEYNIASKNHKDTIEIVKPDDVTLELSLDGFPAIKQEVEVHVAKWEENPSYGFAYSDEAFSQKYAIEQIKAITPTIKFNGAAGTVTCADSICSATHEFDHTNAKQKLLRVEVTTVDGENTYSTEHETTVFVRSFSVASPYYALIGKEALFNCTLVAEEKVDDENLTLTWDHASVTKGEVNISPASYDMESMSWTSTLSVTASGETTSAMIGGITCSTDEAKYAPAPENPTIGLILTMPTISLSSATVKEEDEVSIECKYLKDDTGTLAPYLMFGDDQISDADPRWTMKEMAEDEDNENMVGYEFTSGNVHYSMEGHYSCGGMYTKGAESVKVLSSEAELTVNAHDRTETFADGASSVTMTVTFGEDIKAPVYWEDESTDGEKYIATAASKRDAEEVKATFNGKTTTLTAPAGVFTKTREFKIAATLTSNDEMKYERRALNIFSVKVVNALIDVDTETGKYQGQGFVEYDDLEYKGLPSVSLNDNENNTVDANNHNGNIFIYVSPTKLSGETKVKTTVNFPGDNSNTQTIIFNRAEIEAMPGLDVENNRAIQLDGKDYSKDSETKAITCKFKSAAEYNIIRSYIRTSGGLKKSTGHSEEISLLRRDLDVKESSYSCCFDVTYMDNTVTMSREFIVVEKQKGSKNAGAIAAAVVIAILIIAIIVVFFVYRARKSRGPSSNQDKTQPRQGTDHLPSLATSPPVRQQPSPVASSVTAPPPSPRPPVKTAAATNGTSPPPAADQEKVDEAYTFLDKVQSRFSESDPTVYNKFLAVLGDYHGKRVSRSELLSRVSALLEGHPDLQEGFESFVRKKQRKPAENDYTTVDIQGGGSVHMNVLAEDRA